MPMMASSTSTPSATAKPPSVIVLSVRPMRSSTAIAASSDSGIAREGDQCRAHVPQEQVQHRKDQEGGDEQRLPRDPERALDEIRRPMQAG